VSALDPDAVAELEREQTFLLRSLDDLDAERDAADLDAHDHAQLSDDYTRRLAEVTRALDENRAAYAAIDTKLNRNQRILTIAGVLIVAVLAGVLLGRASGFRSPNDSLSGDIRQSSTGLLSEADVLTREGRWEEAIDVYGEVLDLSPANAEALTYRGWLTNRLGEGNGLDDLNEAVAVAPDYPDARVFRAIVLDDEQRFVDAADDLAIFDTLDPPAEILGIVAGSNLRASIAAGQLAQQFGDGSDIDLTAIKAPLDDVVAGGAILLEVGDTTLALRVFDAVLVEDPENIQALVATGNLQTQPGIIAVSEETGRLGLERLDAAVELLPDDPQIRLVRARARADFDDLDGARSDLVMIDRDLLPEALLALYDDLSLRLG
jgi:tetratricopeptide (TPR) repeat protein